VLTQAGFPSKARPRRSSGGAGGTSWVSDGSAQLSAKRQQKLDRLHKSTQVRRACVCAWDAGGGGGAVRALVCACTPAGDATAQAVHTAALRRTRTRAHTHTHKHSTITAATVTRTLHNTQDLAAAWGLSLLCGLGHVGHMWAGAPAWMHALHHPLLAGALSVAALLGARLARGCRLCALCVCVCVCTRARKPTDTLHNTTHTHTTHTHTPHTHPDTHTTGPGRDIMASGWRALTAGRPDMNSLVGLGAAASFGVSCVAAAVPALRWKTFFEEPAMLLGACVWCACARCRMWVRACVCCGQRACAAWRPGRQPCT
jgi:cation transport ATPase